MAHIFGSGEKTPRLEQQDAQNILDTVFDRCSREPNTASVEEITRRKRRGRVLIILCWILATLALAMVLALPMVFSAARVDIGWMADTAPGSPVLEIRADSFLPIREITAELEGVPQTVREVAEQVYHLYPDRNGKLVLTVTLVNNHSTQATVEVVNVDQTPPQLVSSALKDGVLEILLEDTDSAIDFESIYALDLEGGRVLPRSFSPDTGAVVFGFPDSTLNIFVCDTCGNQLQLILTVD